MKCQKPDCEKDATLRLEVDHLRDNRRLIGFDQADGKIQLMYYCHPHFYEEIRDWLAVYDTRKAS